MHSDPFEFISHYSPREAFGTTGYFLDWFRQLKREDGAVWTEFRVITPDGPRKIACTDYPVTYDGTTLLVIALEDILPYLVAEPVEVADAPPV